MLYTALLKSLFNAVYGEPAEIPDHPRTGLVLVADGVGGLDLCGTGLKYVMGSAQSPHRVQVVPWGHGLGRWHSDLTNTDRHEKQSASLAADVSEWRESRPDAPVFLVGKSGGTGIVVRALEQLPEDSVESAVLLAPALSPEYDLSKALRAVRREMAVFWSPLDVVVLGAGTFLFGTIDRRNSVSAGLVSFKTPKDEETDRLDQYRKLRQVCWNPSMISTGYMGGHVGPDSPAFLRKFVLPILLAEPTPETASRS